ncbi:MAG: protein-glutamate O-methyltransferase CheR [Chthonomonadaceae bacterium]|nr:protein-glutamate O-methyltransferase CheR [Chthonomonadaceae bacterium]
MLPSQSEWDSLYSYVYKASGLDLSKYKPGQMQRRIVTMAEHRQLPTLTEFQKWLTSNQDNMGWFIDKLSINVSEMFRNPEKWVELRDKVLPGLLSNKKSLSCWSAGCSYGAEAHSLAMLLDSCYPGPHKIVGTDIDDAALAQAKSGKYSDADVRCVPSEYKSKYLTKVDGGWQADPNLTAKITFKKQDLLAERFGSNFDLILCRNVVIYFTDEAKDGLYQKFFDALALGGILLVGGTERILGSEQIGFISETPFFYTKPNTRENTWRNAS